MSVIDRNALRMNVWALDAEIAQMMQIPEEYRNPEKVELLRSQKRDIEQQIEEMLEYETLFATSADQL